MYVTNALWVALFAATLDTIGHLLARTPARPAPVAFTSFLSALLVQVLFYPQ